MDSLSSLFEVLANNPSLMEAINPYYRQDPNFVMAAVAYNPALLGFAAPNLVNSPDFVLELGKVQPNVILYMGYNLANNPMFLLEFISRYPQAFQVLEYVNPRCYYDVGFITALYQKNEDIVNYFNDTYKALYMDRLKNSVINNNQSVIQSIVTAYNSILNHTYTSIQALSDFYSQITEKFINVLSDNARKTFLKYEVDGKSMEYYLSYGESYTTAGLMAYRLARDIDITDLLIAEDDDLYGKELMEKQYAEFGITAEMLEPFRKKKAGIVEEEDPAKTGSPAKPKEPPKDGGGARETEPPKGSADDPEDLTAEDIELSPKEHVYPAYDLNQMIISNMAGAIRNAYDEYNNRHNISTVLDSLMSQIKHYRRYIPNFDRKLDGVLIDDTPALDILEFLEKSQLSLIFAEIKKLSKNKSLKKTTRNEHIDRLYKYALRVYDRDVVRDVFYSSGLGKIEASRIDKRNGNVLKEEARRVKPASGANEVDVVVSCLNKTLEVISQRIMGRGSYQDEVVLLNLLDQIGSYCNSSPEIREKLFKTKIGSKTFKQQLTEACTYFCSIRTRVIAERLAARDYDTVADRFDYLMSEYPEVIVKKCCNNFVLNFESLKRITYGRSTPLSLDREVSFRTKDNPVESVVNQLTEINSKRMKGEDVYAAFNKLLNDYNNLSDEQRKYLHTSGDVVVAGITFEDCFNINYCWVLAIDVNRNLLAGRRESADKTLNQMLKMFPKEWVVSMLDEFGIEINPSRGRSDDSSRSSDAPRRRRYRNPEPEPTLEAEPPRRESPATRSAMTPPKSRRRRRMEAADRAEESEERNKANDYLTISLMVSEVLRAVSAKSSYDEGIQPAIDSIYNEIKKKGAKNPDLISDLMYKADTVTGVTVMHDLLVSECLNKMRLARETEDSELDTELKIQFAEVYSECAKLIAGKGRK